jgi:Ca-activated chloride channel family protein
MKKLSVKLIVLSVCISAISIETRTQIQLTQPSLPQTLVKVNLIVTGDSNSLDDVQMEDLQVFDNGVQQTISYFAKDDRPVTYGLVIDTSGSLRPEFRYVIEAAKAIVESNRPDDQTFLIRFVSTDKIETVQELTSDKTTLVAALRSLRVEGGQTALIDALYLAANYAIKHRAVSDGRRLALVLVSDGEDRHSYYTKSQLFGLLSESDVQVFAIGLVEGLDQERGLVPQSPREKATDFLTRLTKETGGRAFLLRNLSELPRAIAEVQRDLHIQYVIGYQPTKNPAETHRKVQVKVSDSTSRKKRFAITRPVIRINLSAPLKVENKQP